MKKIIKQALSFFLISGVGWLMDISLYTILTYIGVHVILSNIISSSVAVTYVYITSTKKLFKNESRINLKVKYIMYIAYQICMILISSYCVYLISNCLIQMLPNVNISSIKGIINLIVEYAKLSAKILVTPFTMVINFIFMKFLIERV
ncbi:MAG: GtrA family protein [Bacilli bacterium]|nr:GtrA family protein [Bacilli bacterium]